MKQNAIETILGTVVLIVAILFIVFAYNTADLQKIEGYTVYADFSNIDGLEVGSDVRISGVKVGSILSLDLNSDNYTARAAIGVLSSIELPLDTVAIVSSEGLLGGKYLALEPGGDPDFLASGDIIEYTQSTPSLEKLIGQAIYSFQGQNSDDTAE